jgi:integral membrane protein
MKHSPISYFRISGFIEGSSLLILLFIAMPLKYFAGLPEVVTVVGSLHGFFFVLYILITGFTTLKVKWHLGWPIAAVIVAFIPFGNFILDWRLKKTKLA